MVITGGPCLFEGVQGYTTLADRTWLLVRPPRPVARGKTTTRVLDSPSNPGHIWAPCSSWEVECRPLDGHVPLHGASAQLP